MNLNELNWLAVLVSAASAFALGGLWYGPLFGKAWQALVGLSDEDIQQGNPARIFGGSFVLNLVTAFGLGMMLQLHPAPSLVAGLSAGGLIGLALVATNFGINYLFAQRPLRLYFIDAGYIVLLLVVMGAILGAWR